MRLVFILCFLWWVTPIMSQSYLVQTRELSVENGLLSNRNSHCFYHDVKQGFMWIGTSNGLNRFDGISTTLFGKNAGLQAPVIIDILSDFNGKFWLLHKGEFDPQNQISAISIFDPIATKGIPLSDYLHLPFSVTDILRISPFPNGEMAIITKNKEVYCYGASGLRKIIPKIEVMLNPGVIIYKGKANDYWVSILHVLHHYDATGKMLAAIPLKRNKVVTNGEHVLFYHTGPDSINISGLDYLPLDSFWTSIHSNVAHNLSFYLHNTKTTLLLKNLQGEILTTIPLNDIVRHHYVDAHQNIWLAYKNGHVACISIKKNRFGHYTAPNARGFLKQQEKALYTTSSKLLALAHVNATPQAYQLPNELLAILQGESTETIWVSDFATGLYRVNLTTSERQVFSYPTHLPKQNHSFWSMHRDRQKRLWLGHNEGISFLRTADSVLVHYQDYNEFSSLNTSTVYHFHENDQGIWLATSKGLYLLDRQKGIIRHIHKEGEKGNKIAHDLIVHLHEDTSGGFWLASKGGGLLYWHPLTGEHRQFSTQEGFHHDVIYEVYEDEYGYLWMGSNDGLIRFHKENHRFQVFKEQNGIANNEFNTVSHYQDKQGRLYFGGLNGMTVFHPKDFIQDITLREQPLLIKQVGIQNEKGETEECDTAIKNPYHLKWQPGQINLSIDFVLVDFLTSDQVQYAYQIKGFNTQWQALKKSYLQLNHLPYGTHQLAIRGKRLQQSWSTPLLIIIEVVRPLYLQTWFIVLLSVLFTATVVAIIRYRLRYLEKAKDKLELIIQERTQKIEIDKKVIEQQAAKLVEADEMKNHFFSNISHELRTPLTLITAPIYDLKTLMHAEPTGQAQQLLSLMERNTTSLKRLVDAILDLSKLDAQQLKLHEKKMEIIPFIKQLYADFESHAVYLGLDFNLALEEITTEWIWADQEKLRIILHNLISNALKFTPKTGKVQLILSQSNQGFTFYVKDTGRGIHEKDQAYIFDRFFQSKPNGQQMFQAGTGIGLSFTKSLIELMQGTIHVQSKEGKGTIFTFHLPIKIAEAPQENYLLSDQEDLPSAPTLVVPSVKGTPQETVLIVEDNPDMHQYIKSLLCNDYQLISAYNGIEALQQLKQQPEISCIVSDLMMPEMDGIALLTTLRADTTWQRIPVMMLTASGSDSARLKALTVGIDDYLTKPFIPQELLVRIANIMERHRARVSWKKESELEDILLPTPITTTETTVTASQPTHTTDMIWLKKVELIVKRELENSQFNQEALAEEMHLSKKQLARKIKKTTGLTLLGYQREIALQLARGLLESRSYDTVKAVAYEAGFKNIYYFSKLYLERFGKNPKQYLL